MPMRITPVGDIEQTFAAPSIYFDHWAIREFADDKALQDRLVELVHRKGATFVLSIWNLAEFSGPSDSRAAERAEDLLERIMPNVYVTDFQLQAAVDRDAEALAGGLRAYLSPCRWLIQAVLRRSLDTGGLPSLRGSLSQAHAERDRLSEHFAGVNQAVRDKLLEQRTDAEYVRGARSAVPEAGRTRLFVVLGELMRDLILDPNAPITVNDASDYLHAALPAMACDYVLLDRAWRARVERMRDRFRQHQYQMPVAQCFSKADDGLRRFLDALETLPAA